MAEWCEKIECVGEHVVIGNKRPQQLLHAGSCIALRRAVRQRNVTRRTVRQERMQKAFIDSIAFVLLQRAQATEKQVLAAERQPIQKHEAWQCTLLVYHHRSKDRHPVVRRIQDESAGRPSVMSMGVQPTS